MSTTHQYLDKYPITEDSLRLIVGTIHPHEHLKFKVKFFYGNRGTLWKILHKAFPSELVDPGSLESILSFLRARKIAMSDVVASCERRKPTALDADLINIKPHTGMIEQIRRSAISDIYFTSGLGTNGAFRLFYSGLLKLPLTAEVRGRREILLDEGAFGRPVRLHILHSPAGTGNIALSRNKDYLASRHKYVGVKGPVEAFKVDYYREMFKV